MPLFGKKNKGASDDIGLEVMDSAENNAGEVKVKGKSAFSHIKKKFRLIVKTKDGKNSSDDDSESGISDGDNEKGKKTKAKKEKKPKVKKEKKPKEPKKKKSKEQGDSEDGEQGKKPFPILIIIIGVAVLAIGAAAFFIIPPMLNQPTVEEQLATARQHIAEQQYPEAQAIYDKLLKKDETLVDAYLGRADILVAEDQTEAAIEGLRAALELTENDPIILARIDALENPPDAEPIKGDAATPSNTQSADGEATPAVTAAPVRFSDPVFEKMMRIALKKSNTDQITNQELANIVTLKILGGTHASVDESFKATVRAESYEVDGETYTERGEIKTLDDLKYFTGLRRLVVAYNVVYDIKGISELESLETVGVYCNDIVDISPLSSLESLKYLYVYNNYIRDISPIANLTNLQQLWLNKNNISDISPLRNLTNLTELYINDNRIKDISVVANLKKLNFLYFDDNQVTDIFAVKDLPMLTDISYLNNPITDTYPAEHIKRINRPYF